MSKRKAKLLIKEAIKMVSMVSVYGNVEDNSLYLETAQERLVQTLKELEEEHE